MIEIIKENIKFAIAQLHKVSSVFEKDYNKVNNLTFPPAFIIGPPRSGSTILYQLLLQSFHVTYIPNISNLFYMCPIFAAKIALKNFPKYQSSFSSKYGYEKGLLSPSEAGNVWNRWFPAEKIHGFNYTPAGYLNTKSKKEIFGLVAWFQKIFNAPFISKNLKMSVRLQALHEIFPNALFIKCNRSPVDSAYSILNIRRKEKISWWSVMPKEIELIKWENEIKQVCKQVFFIEKNIKEDLQLFNPANIINIDYIKLCENTSNELNNIFDFFNKNKIPIERILHGNQQKIKISNSQKKHDNEYLQIKSIMDELFSMDIC